MIQTRHFPICQFIPKNVRKIIENKSSNTNNDKGSPNKKKGFNKNEYFEECARNKGLVDTDEGVRFVVLPGPTNNGGGNDTSSKVAASAATAASKHDANDSIIGRNVFAVSASSKKEDNGTYEEDEDVKMTTSPTNNAAARSNNNDDITTYSEIEMLERTRHELLNGRDFWICTACAVSVPSLTQPCGKCHKMITFVPLEVEEFEEFVQKQRAMKRRADMMMRMKMKEEEEEEESSSSGDEEESEESEEDSDDKEFDRLQRARKQQSRKKSKTTKVGLKKRTTVVPKLEETGPITYKILDPNMPLLSEEDKSMVTTYTYFTMEQMRPCNFDKSHEGNTARNHVDDGFPGLECIHCAHLDKPRRFFYRTAENYSGNWQHIPEHLLNQCKGCPEDVKRKLEKKKKKHDRQRRELPKGSQREFFDMIWTKLHEN